MKKLLKQNYNSTVKRGLIKLSTTDKQFIDKVKEELQEFETSINDFGCCKETYIECCDIILTCMNFLHHKGVNTKALLKHKININKRR